MDVGGTGEKVEQGASNAIWVWSPNVSYTGSTSLAGLYPGDDFVDWEGVDGYDGGTELSPRPAG